MHHMIVFHHENNKMHWKYSRLLKFLRSNKNVSVIKIITIINNIIFLVKYLIQLATKTDISKDKIQTFELDLKNLFNVCQSLH